jgi:putative Ca2+/H+ antiporter (TMEM165/GDT1 family)
MYTIAMLRMRFRSSLIYTGIAAFAAKMAVAVLLGSVLLRIPPRWTSVGTGIVLLSASVAVWRREEDTLASDVHAQAGTTRVMLTAFASLFFTEWADPGQMTAAAIAGQTHMPLAAWLGATLALSTKGFAAVLIASTVGRGFTVDRMRPMSALILAGMGLSALVGVWS